jgi:hypothetical protein
MGETDVEQKRPRGNKSTGNLARIERDLKAYELHLAGVTVRGVCQELGIKSTQTAFNAIKRGRDYCIERGINLEERKIEIDKLFKETLGHLAQTIRHQSEHGCETFFINEDGSKSMKKIKGVDPRIAGELSRSLHRWSEFLGLMDRAPEVTNQAVTMVQLTAPADGASFGSKWGSNGESGHESGHEMPSAHGDPAPALAAPTDAGAVIDIGDGCSPALQAGGQSPPSPAATGEVIQPLLEVAQNPAQNDSGALTAGGRRTR